MTPNHGRAPLAATRRAPSKTTMQPQDTAAHAVAPLRPGRPRGHAVGLRRELRDWLRSDEHCAACPLTAGRVALGGHTAPAAVAGLPTPQTGHGGGWV